MRLCSCNGRVFVFVSNSIFVSGVLDPFFSCQVSERVFSIGRRLSSWLFALSDSPLYAKTRPKPMSYLAEMSSHITIAPAWSQPIRRRDRSSDLSEAQIGYSQILRSEDRPLDSGGDCRPGSPAHVSQGISSQPVPTVAKGSNPADYSNPSNWHMNFLAVGFALTLWFNCS